MIRNVVQVFLCDVSVHGEHRLVLHSLKKCGKQSRRVKMIACLGATVATYRLVFNEVAMWRMRRRQCVLKTLCF